MDDDGSKKLDFDEFKKGIHDYGLLVEDAVSIDTVPCTLRCQIGSSVRALITLCIFS